MVKSEKVKMITGILVCLSLHILFQKFSEDFIFNFYY